MYEVIQRSEIEADLIKLPEKVVQEAVLYFERYKENPLKYSQPLYNQGGLNLKGCRKTYIADRKYRIVFEIENTSIKIVSVIAVGPREDKQVYIDADKRLNTN